ncbi:MAG: diphthine--ammonia ligase [Angelakisella sp.]
MYKANPFTQENERQGKRFVASFSGGKDSMLAIYRCIQYGMVPMRMLTTCPADAGQSWFHRVSAETLHAVSEAVGIPIELIKTSGDDYKANFAKALIRAREEGAEVAVFGDIDIEEHLEWCCNLCQEAGITPYFPLWQEPREKLVREFIDSGFTAKIIVVRHANLQEGYLGQPLTHALLDRMAACGVDVCGENGEYHTLVTNGPIFAHPVTEVAPC